MSAPKTATLRRTSRTRRHLRVRKKVVGIDRRVRAWWCSVPPVTSTSRWSTTRRRARSCRRRPSTSGVRGSDGDKKALAAAVGKLVAERAKAAGIEKVVFDRGGNRYHGRIAALADAAREGGLDF